MRKQYLIFGLMLFLLVFSVNALLTDGLVLYYTMDGNTTSAILINDSTRLNNGTITNAFTALNVLGIINESGQSATTKVDIAISNSISSLSNSDFTANMWLKPTLGASTYLLNFNAETLILGLGTNGGFTKGAMVIYDGSWRGNNSCIITDNVWNFVTYNARDNIMLFFINGVNCGNVTVSDKTISYFSWLRHHSSTAQFYIGLVDEFSLYNRSLSNAEITQLYNNSAGIQYPFIISEPQPTASMPNYIINISTDPQDLNTSVYKMLFNASVYDTNYNLSSTGTATLFKKLVTGVSYCSVFTNGVCDRYNNSYTNYTMNKVNNSLFNYTLDDTELFSAYYGYNESIITSTPKTSNYTVYYQNSIINQNIRFMIHNFSVQANKYYINLEFDTNNLSGLSPLLIYYCNNSYITGDPKINVNCELVDSFIALNSFKHTHNNSKHFTIPVNINNVTKTQNSSFIFTSTFTQTQGWNFGYFTDTRYNNRSYKIGSYDNWIDTPNIFDIHYHYFYDDDKLIYYVNYSNSTASNISQVYTKYYNITTTPPSAGIFISPVCDQVFTLDDNDNVTINFSWLPSFSQDDCDFTYNLSVYIDDFNIINLNTSINQNTTNYLYTGNSLPINTYLYPYNLICDVYNNCDISLGCSFSICESDWNKTIQPCLGSARLIVYQDLYSCGGYFTIPNNNNTYEYCESGVIKMTIDAGIYLSLLILGLIILSLIIGLRSNGIYKGGFIAVSGAFMIPYIILLRTYVFSSDLSSVYYTITNIVASLMFLIAVLLIIIGFINLFKKNV